MKIILDLNQYQKQTYERIIQPLLRENDCHPSSTQHLTSWEFIAKSKPKEIKGSNGKTQTRKILFTH